MYPVVSVVHSVGSGDAVEGGPAPLSPSQPEAEPEPEPVFSALLPVTGPGCIWRSQPNNTYAL